MSNKTPFNISVIVPYFNESHYLPFALDSINAQLTENDIETLVINDGSTSEETKRAEEICQRFPNTKLISQPNGGVSAARNRGIEEAAGLYIAFLDCDDVWLPGKLAAQIQILEKDAEIGFIYSDFCYVDDSLNHPRRVYCSTYSISTPNNLANYFVNDAPFMTSTVVVRKSLLIEVGLFDLKQKIAEDTELWLRLLIHSHPFHIKDVHVWKREVEGSLGSALDQKLDQIERLNQTAVSYAPQLASLVPKRNARRYSKAGQAAESRHDLKRARNLYLEAWGYDRSHAKALLLWTLSFLPLRNRIFSFIKSTRNALHRSR
tara:strand:- start:82215 stop:83171 length:957 start_codon:yes stop_codon:yes gene_type:complete